METLLWISLGAVVGVVVTAVVIVVGLVLWFAKRPSVR